MNNAQQHPTIVIAEIGVNHQGSLDMAKRMIAEAAAAGVDYVKFQTFKAENLVCASAERAEYQKENCGGNESQLDMLRRYELSAEDFREIIDECRRQGVGFMSSPFDLESIDLLASLGMKCWKIPSGEITNLPYLRAVARVADEVIMSTGMSTPDEIAAAVDALAKAGLPAERLTLLHCTTQYPAPFDQINLRAMDSLRSFGCNAVGYSDHTPGIAVPIAAVALGAAVIEKHFTLDTTLPGPDHKASLEPHELRAMVKAVREVEQALGSDRKTTAQCELANRLVARKSIVAACHIKAGELLTEKNLAVKRPGTGLSAMRWDEVTGTRAIRDYSPDQQIEL